jgi:hypothetical protein
MPSLSEIINAATGKTPLPEAPVAAPAAAPVVEAAPEPEPSAGVSPQHLIDLAQRAASLTDKARECNAEAGEARKELQLAMESVQADTVDLEDRQIGFKESKSKSKTLGALKGILGDETGKKVWDALPTTTSRRLDVPKPNVDEPEQ